MVNSFCPDVILSLKKPLHFHSTRSSVLLFALCSLFTLLAACIFLILDFCQYIYSIIIHLFTAMLEKAYPRPFPLYTVWGSFAVEQGLISCWELWIFKQSSFFHAFWFQFQEILTLKRSNCRSHVLYTKKGNNVGLDIRYFPYKINA